MRQTPSRNLHNLTFAVHTPVDGLVFTLEGMNLTDERPVDVAGYPLPGRSVYSSVNYRY
jgi:outer membrane receptor protein involved in Fe transport